MAATAAPMAPATSDDEPDFLPLNTLRTQLSDYETVKRNERDEAEQARRYYHGDQIAPHILAALRERNQPPVVYNLIRRKVDGTVGLIERLRQDPKAFPRTPQHQAGADVATAVLNDVLETQKWKSLTPFIAKDGAIEPMAGVELSIEGGDQGDPDIGIHYLEPDTVFYDPRSSREDFSDSRFFGVAKWVSLDQAQGMFPEHAEALKTASGSGAFDALVDTDRQRQVGWSNQGAKHVRLVEHWYKRHGEWLWQFYCGDLDLARGVSPFLDEKGRTFCRFILFSANVDHDNDRYSITRDLRPIQDEINHRRSKALHALNTIRLLIKGGYELDPDKKAQLRAELHKNDGIIDPPAGVEIEQVSNADQVSGNLQMLQEAKAMIETFGPNPSLVGSAPASASGRALQLLQQAGIAELGPYILGYRDWKMRVYRAVWNTVQRYWTAQRWIRVTDDQGLAQFLAVNRLGVDPATGRPIIENALGSLDVDIIIDEGPDHQTLMEDTLDALMQLAPGMAQAGKPIPPEIIIELASLPQATKDKLLGYLQQASQPNPAAEAAQHLQLQGAAAKVEETQARAEKLRADAGAAQADGARAGADAAETLARTRRQHADATAKEMDTALRFMPPEPTPYDGSEAPYAEGAPTMPGLPPQALPAPPGVPL